MSSETFFSGDYKSLDVRDEIKINFSYVFLMHSNYCVGL